MDKPKPRTLAVKHKTAAAVKREAARNGRKVGVEADMLLNEALAARIAGGTR